MHYYYGPATEKPRHHRFDKGSYLYLYENADERRARIEIANNAGTEDQDAFDGRESESFFVLCVAQPGLELIFSSLVLDNVKIEYDYKHPTLVTVKIDAYNSPTTYQQPPETQEWRLPTYDPRNETKYLYKLHSFDVYLWTVEDATLFMNTIRRLVPGHHLHIEGEPAHPPAHTDAMSPLVRNLEHVAISHHNPLPQQQPQQYAHSQHSSSSKPGSVVQQQSLPGPPGAPPQQQQAPAPAPFAYNPAAPPAPEVLAHREKTPPPEDGGANPLLMAASDQLVQPQGQYFNQQQPQFSPQAIGRTQTMHVQSPGISYFSGPPKPGSGQYAPGAQQAQPQAQLALSPQPAGTPYGQPGVPGGYTPGTPGYGQQQAAYPASPGFSGPPPPNSTQQYGSQQGYSLPIAPTAPAGGFSNFNYGAQQQGGNEYAVHNQVYRPTEGEAAVKVNKMQEGGAGPGGIAGKIGGNAVRLEKGVTGFLKKFEKKYA